MKLHLKPAPKKTVFDPATKKPLPEEGALVEDSAYWRRRLADKDVVRIDPPKAADKPAKKEA